MLPLIPDEPNTFRLFERFKNSNHDYEETIQGFGPHFNKRLLATLKSSSLGDNAEQNEEKYARHLALTRLDYQYDLAKIFAITF